MNVQRFNPLPVILGLEILLVSAVIGCHGTASVSRPKFDPAASAAQAIKELDKNSDQKLSKDELQIDPGLLAAFDQFDQDRDGSIALDELQMKLTGIQKQGAGIIAITCTVRHGGQPLEGATVKFVPESFLVGAVSSASGVTAADGTAFPSVPDEELPSEIRGKVRGVPSGVFRVEVTHPSIQIPAKFNSQSTIGRLVTRRDHEPLVIDL